jgi:hypothetical protein
MTIPPSLEIYPEPSIYASDFLNGSHNGRFIYSSSLNIPSNNSLAYRIIAF